MKKRDRISFKRDPTTSPVPVHVTPIISKGYTLNLDI